MSLVREGLLNGLAEIGRPHYKTSPEHIVLADTFFGKVLEIARMRQTLPSRNFLILSGSCPGENQRQCIPSLNIPQTIGEWLRQYMPEDY